MIWVTWSSSFPLEQWASSTLPDSTFWPGFSFESCYRFGDGWAGADTADGEGTSLFILWVLKLLSNNEHAQYSVLCFLILAVLWEDKTLPGVQCSKSPNRRSLFLFFLNPPFSPEHCRVQNKWQVVFRTNVTHLPKRICSNIWYNEFLLVFIIKNRGWVAIYYHSKRMKGGGFG